jgi:hypothetical protein
MTITLNRNKVFFIGLGIIFIFLLLNRIDYIIGSTTTTGKVQYVRHWTSRSSRYTAPVIEFQTEDYEIKFQGETNMPLHAGETVNVIYKIKDPTNAEVYSFIGFWLSPLLYCILPLIFLVAITFSFLTHSDVFVVNIGKRFTITKTTQMQLDGEEKKQ